MAVYFAVSFSLSLDRLHALLTGNWDLGIFQQALWTGSHGGSYFEVGDYEVSGIPSYLIVHPALLLLALTPLYAALPSPVTLLALQSGVVAATGFPIYFLGRRVLARPWLALAPVAAFLAWMPLLTGNLYDFHLESFLPLEIVSLFFLWYTGRFAAGFAVAVLAFVTLEVTPILVVFLALYFLVPSRGDFADLRTRVRARGGSAARLRAVFGCAIGALRTRRIVRMSLALAAAAVVAYGGLRYLEWTLLPPWLGGVAAFPADGAVGYWINLGPGVAGVPPTPSRAGPLALDLRLRNWILLYALVAFVPLLAPRTQILQIPWFAFTLLEARFTFTQVGWQNDIIAGAPLAVGFVFGLAFLLERGAAWRPSGVDKPRSAEPTSRRASIRRWRVRSPSGGTGVGVLAVGLVLANAALGPLGPARSLVGPVGPGYEIARLIPPGYNDLVHLAGLVPSTASIAATDDLFDFVADNGGAYAFLPEWPSGQLPGFSPSHRPVFVFFTEDWWWTVPAWLRPYLNDPAAYSLWGIAWTTPRGPALLFGPPSPGRIPMTLGATPTLPQVFEAAQLPLGPSGQRLVVPGSAGDALIRGAPGSVGAIWYGPYAELPAGRYIASLRLAVVPSDPAAPPAANASVLDVAFAVQPTAVRAALAQPSAAPTVVATLTYAEAGSGRWSWVDISFQLPDPVFRLQIIGWAAPGGGTYAELATMVLLPAVPSDPPAAAAVLPGPGLESDP